MYNANFGAALVSEPYTRAGSVVRPGYAPALYQSRRRRTVEVMDGLGGFGALIPGAKKKSANTKILQKALKEAGYKPGTIDGSYGTNTQAAMQELQAAKGLAITDWPDNYVLAGLNIPYDKWVGIVTDSGAPANVVNGIAQRVAGRSGLPSDDAGAPKAVTLPSGEEIIVEATQPIPGTGQEVATLPSGEQIIVEKTAVAPAAAAVSGSSKLWFKKNWPYLAAGGGVGLLAIIGAVLWTRKREEAPPKVTPGDVEHMAGLRGFGRRYMTKAEAVREFKEEVLPYVVAQYGKDDRPAIREAWNDWTDMLQKDGRISAKQYNTWVGPFKGLGAANHSAPPRRPKTWEESEREWARKTAEARRRGTMNGYGDWEHPWSYHKAMVRKHKNWMREHEAGMYGGKLGASGPRPSAMRGFGMTKKEAEAEFRADVMPYVVAQYGRDDRIALAEEWSNWTDMLRSEGRITRKQYETWVNPF